MKVLIVVYEDVDKRDNLTTRMIDAKIERLVAEFRNNDVPIQVIRDTEIKKWWAESFDSAGVRDTDRPNPIQP